MKKAQLFDPSQIEQIPWPSSECGTQARELLVPLIKEGVDAYIANVKTKLFLLLVDDLVLPLSVNEEEYQNSYVASNYYPVMSLAEKQADAKLFLQPFQRSLGWTLGHFFRWIKVNRIVIVNNWLFSTNLYPQISEDQVTRISACLREHFPDHVHLFRGVNTLRGSDFFQALKKEAYQLVGIRYVYIYDPETKKNLSSKVQYHHRRDLRLVETHGYSIVTRKDFSEEDLNRFLDLYRKVYIDKYTAYSPAYTFSYLKQALKSGVIDFIGLKKEGRIDGIMGLRILNGMMTVPFFGYDTSIPTSVGLYRMMSVLAIKEAEKRGVILNDSSGASTPKKFRGLKPFPEYMAIYDKHLPLNRRLFWKATGKILNTVFPLMKK